MLMFLCLMKNWSCKMYHNILPSLVSTTSTFGPVFTYVCVILVQQINKQNCFMKHHAFLCSKMLTDPALTSIILSDRNILTQSLNFVLQYSPSSQSSISAPFTHMHATTVKLPSKVSFGNSDFIH